MIKFRLYYDKDKETLWLNEMADQGYALTGFFAGFYTFEQCEPGKYRYQIDFSERPFSLGTNYREFMEEMDIEIVLQWFFWVILRKKTDKGEFQLYTDVDSALSHYLKIRTLFKVTIIIETICFTLECIGCIIASASNELYSVFFVFILAIIIISMLRAVVTFNKIIAELKERKGEPSKQCMSKNSQPSPFLIGGLLLNGFSLLMGDGFSVYTKHFIQITAIILMLVGIYRSRHIFYND